MYRIICNSLKNYASDFNQDVTDPRYKPIVFLRLIENIEEYERNKKQESIPYKMLSHFLWSVSDCDYCEQILFELALLGIEGKNYFNTLYSPT